MLHVATLWVVGVGVVPCIRALTIVVGGKGRLDRSRVVIC
jgi:hypothetical protein